MELLVSLLYSTINYIVESIDDIMGWAMRRLLRSIMVVFSWVVVPYSRIVNITTSSKKLPAIENELLKISATKLAKLIRNQQLKSETLILAYIERCKEVNPLLNAIVENRFETALEEARAVDDLIQSGKKTIEEMEEETPLLGIPITVKESIGVKGMSNQGGRVHKKKRIAQEDAPCVEQVKKAGAIVLLVSNTPELCLCWETYNKVSGRTKNPHDLRRTPGGSSGGEGALLGSGASLLSLSSDVAGSARLPAMFNGIFGHKPSPYAVSPNGHVPMATASNWGDYFTMAPMTRYAEDIELLLKAMSDPDGTKLTLDSKMKVSDIKFYYMDDCGFGLTRPLSSGISAGLNKVATHFKAKKVHVDQLKWSLDMSMSSMLRLENLETIYNQISEQGEPSKKINTEFLKYLVGLSDSSFTAVLLGPLQHIMSYFPESRHKKLDGIRESLKVHFEDMLGKDGVFLYPTFPTSAHQHYQIYHKLTDTAYMMIFNTLGMPVTNCMVGVNKNKMPVGIQVVANPGQDHLTIAVAKEIEKLYGGWVEPSSS